MPRILVAVCKQEISSFNPVVSRYEDFSIQRGDELFVHHRDIESETNGALEVFGQRSDVEVVPAWGAQAGSGGPLVQDDFERLAAECIEAVAAHAGQVEAFYFSLHGAMGATGELDPEGYLLQEARRLLGREIPLVISLDLHGILT
ncbi:uncharacterized protein METZ01_LOCUS474742, partial [marine metagenome]